MMARRFQENRKLITSLALLSALLITVAIYSKWAQSFPPSTSFIFEIEPPPKFLTEELAVKKATESLRRLYPKASFLCQQYSSTRDPSGRSDEAFLRNGVNPNSGMLHFADRSMGLDRIVIVSLSTNRVICQVCRSK